MQDQARIGWNRLDLARTADDIDNGNDNDNDNGDSNYGDNNDDNDIEVDNEDENEEQNWTSFGSFYSPLLLKKYSKLLNQFVIHKELEENS